ncbi:MAG: CinA family nicotinamide mononucleotide deamidase-related protein [Mucinivorans sp.]
MVAEIITIGDELLCGQVVDTNSAFIGQRFAQAGLPVARINSIGDELGEIIHTLTEAMNRSQVVIVTGGLGPTKDDITKKALCKLFDCSMVRHKATYESNRLSMKAKGIDFNASNQAQADVPSVCQVIVNDNGSAPCMLFRRGGALMFCLPGVPFEMKALITDKIIPLLAEEFTLQNVIHHTVLTFGIAESVLSETIAPWEDALPHYLHLAYLPNPRGIRLRLSAYQVENREGVEQEINAQFGQLKSLIEPFFLGDEPTSVEGELFGLLCCSGQTLAVAESCTGGLISARLTMLSGVSKVYLGGVTSYSNGVKEAILGVQAKDIERHGAVSEQVAVEMACGVREKLSSDFGIATTGVAGPTGGTTEKPVGTVWIAIAWEGGSAARLMQLGSLREQNIERAATHALNMLRLHLLGLSEQAQNTGMY